MCVTTTHTWKFHVQCSIMADLYTVPLFTVSCQQLSSAVKKNTLFRAFSGKEDFSLLHDTFGFTE